MKLDEIKIGETYLTRIGGKLVRVVVKAAIHGRTLSYSTGKDGPARWQVARVDTGVILPKPRTSAALHEAKRVFRGPGFTVEVRGDPCAFAVAIPKHGFRITSDCDLAANAASRAGHALLARAVFGGAP